YNGLAVGFPIVAAFLLRKRDGTRRPWLGAVCAAALFALLLAFCFPFLGLKSEQAGVDTQVKGSNVSMFGHIVGLELFNGRGFGVIAETLAAYDPWVTGLALLGLVTVLALLVRGKLPLDAERKRDLVVVLAYAVPYLVAIGLYQRTY